MSEVHFARGTEARYKAMLISAKVAAARTNQSDPLQCYSIAEDLLDWINEAIMVASDDGVSGVCLDLTEKEYFNILPSKMFKNICMGHLATKLIEAGYDVEIDESAEEITVSWENVEPDFYELEEEEDANSETSQGES